MPQPSISRDYNSATRAAQSHATRQRIVESARDLMLERGYRSTTIAAIARHADVHVDTIYELVGRKPMVLRELIEQAISGSDAAVPADERDYVAAIRNEPDPRAKLAIYARATREIHQRMAPLVLALRDASATEKPKPTRSGRQSATGGRPTCANSHVPVYRARSSEVG